MRGLKAFARDKSGVTVVEFAILGPLFFVLIGATFETGITFFASYALDAAVIDTSRLFRTHQTVRVATIDDYRAELCSELYGVFDCDALKISVREIDDFYDFSTSAPVDSATGDWTMTEEYDALPNEPAYVMIEAYYKWPTFVNIPALHQGLTADGKRLLAATHVLKTEPTS